MYCRGAIIGTAKIELAGNKVLRNDLAAPRSGALALEFRETLFLPDRSRG